MYNAKPAIAAALSTDPQLIALIPKVRMFEGFAVFTEKPIFPYLTYEELANLEGEHADDEEVESEVAFRFHIFGTSSVSTLAGHVDRVLKSIGFGRINSNDVDEILESGLAVKHKVLSYTGTFSI